MKIPETMNESELLAAVKMLIAAPNVSVQFTIKEERSKRKISPYSEAQDKALADKLLAIQKEGQSPMDMPIVAITDLNYHPALRNISSAAMVRALKLMGATRCKIQCGGERIRAWIVADHETLDTAPTGQLADIYAGKELEGAALIRKMYKPKGAA